MLAQTNEDPQISKVNGNNCSLFCAPAQTMARCIDRQVFGKKLILIFLYVLFFVDFVSKNFFSV